MGTKLSNHCCYAFKVLTSSAYVKMSQSSIITDYCAQLFRTNVRTVKIQALEKFQFFKIFDLNFVDEIAPPKAQFLKQNNY